MSMTLVDTLPMDAGTQKFIGPVNPEDDEFALQRACNVETSGDLDYGDVGVSQGARQGDTTQTHDGVSVSTSESVGTEVDSDGYTRAAIFVDVGAGADVRVRVYGRLTTGGDNYLQELVVDGQEESTKAVYLVDIAAPYLAIGLQAVSGSADCSCSVYLLP
jgi:hypothetical protein